MKLGQALKKRGGRCKGEGINKKNKKGGKNLKKEKIHSVQGTGAGEDRKTGKNNGREKKRAKESAWLRRVK